jgi:TetR/AcrR family transcriptional regulator, cholesterol catabolism regulator
MTVILSRRERKKEETRHRIFHAAIELFRERGFEQTTVDEITEKADVAKGTFFNYFPRKDAVLGFLSETRLLVVEENSETILAEDRPVREKLLDVYSTAASAYEEDRELSRFVLIELMARAFTPSEEVAVRWHQQIVRMIRQGQENGELRSDVDALRIEAMLTGLYYATLYEWVCRAPSSGVPCTPPGCLPLLEELHARLTLAMEGIAS